MWAKEILVSRYLAKYNYVFPVCLFIVATVLWYLGYSKVYFVNPDAFDYAQIGREIFTGHGSTTAQIFPRHIPYLAAQGYLINNIGHWPNLYRYPLPTFANAISQFLIRDDIVAAAIAQSGFWSLLSIPLLFIFAKKLTNSSMVAFLSSIFYMSDKTFWVFSYNGLTESLSIFLILLLFSLIFSDMPYYGRWLLVGIVCGLAILTRTQLAPLLLVAIVFAWIKSTTFPIRTSALVVLGTVIAIAPWAIRNSLLTGDPLFSFSTSRNLVLGTSNTHSDLEMQLYAPIQTHAIFRKYGSSILSKVLWNSWPEILSPSNVVGSPVYGFVLITVFLLSFLSRLTKIYIERDYALFKWGILVVIYVNFLVISFAFLNERFLILYHPFILIIGFQEIFTLSTKPGFTGTKTVLVLIFLAACIFYSLNTLQGFISVHSKQSSNIEQSKFKTLSEITGQNSVIASDLSYEISLYNENPTIRLPAFPEQLLEINNKFITIDYVLLSASIAQFDMVDEPPSLFETYSSYGHFINTQAFTETYQLVTKLSDGSILYKLTNQHMNH